MENISLYHAIDHIPNSHKIKSIIFINMTKTYIKNNNPIAVRSQSTKHNLKRVHI